VAPAHHGRRICVTGQGVAAQYEGKRAAGLASALSGALTGGAMNLQATVPRWFSERCLLLLLLVTLLAMTAGCAGNRTHFNQLALIGQASEQERRELTLPFDAYIVGIEKDNASRVGSLADCPGAAGGDCLAIDAPYLRERPDLRDALHGKYAGQHRPTYVSHIARFGPDGQVCFLYNIYATTDACAPLALPAAPEERLVTRSWRAMSTLGRDLERLAGERKFSHVIVYTMGWNTYQPEALRNIRDLATRLREAAAGDPAFRPLVLGVTWPSTGDPTIPMADFGIKAKDADEVGAVWENILLNRELRRIKATSGFRLVVVGHSFGARAATRAVFSAPLVTAAPTPVVDLLVSLQGAYSYQRYLATDAGDAEGREGAPYRDFATLAGPVVLTASRHDTAVLQARHARYFVGSHVAFDEAGRGPHAARFLQTATADDGRVPALACAPQRVMWIDASSVIKGNQPGTGGGAHSVVYTPEIGRLVYQLIRTCAS